MPALLVTFIALVAAVTTAVLGLLGAGFLANACVRWYHISSFEGGSGYFVMFIGLFGGIAGFLVGLGTALFCLLAGTRYAGWSSVPVAWGAAGAILVAATGLSFVLAPPARPAAVPSSAANAPAADGAGDDDADVDAGSHASGAEVGAMPPDGASLVDLIKACERLPDSMQATEVARRIDAWPNLADGLAPIVTGEDAELAGAAMRSMRRLALAQDPAIVVLTKAGEDIAGRLERFLPVTPEEDPSYLGAADVGIRFSGWIDAVRSLRVSEHEHVDAALGHLLVRMLEGSRRRPDSHVLRQDVCRVASFYAREWLGLAPAADDPPPR